MSRLNSSFNTFLPPCDFCEFFIEFPGHFCLMKIIMQLDETALTRRHALASYEADITLECLRPSRYYPVSDLNHAVPQHQLLLVRHLAINLKRKKSVRMYFSAWEEEGYFAVPSYRDECQFWVVFGTKILGMRCTF